MILDIDDGRPDFSVKPSDSAPASLSPADWLPRALIRRWRALRRDRQRRAITRFLHGMDSHALRDIGFDRSEIKMAARDLIERLDSAEN